MSVGVGSRMAGWTALGNLRADGLLLSMMRSGLLRLRGTVVLCAATLGAVMRIEIMVAICQEVGWLRLLLMALRRRPLGLLLATIFERPVLPLLALSLVCLPPVQRPRLAFGAEVIEVFARGLLNVSGIEAFDVLPGLAFFAVDRITVVIRVVADALDSVGLLVNRVGGDRRTSSVIRGRGMRDGLTLRDRRWY